MGGVPGVFIQHISNSPPAKSMNPPTIGCLILASGNTLRSDDGVGPFLAEWAEGRFQPDARVQVISRQQWTPELAEDVSRAESVLFIDCSIEAAPGSVDLMPVLPAETPEVLATHHLGAPELLALSWDFYRSLPANAQILTIGAGSIELGETFSEVVQAALPEARRTIEETVQRLLDSPATLKK